MLVLATLPASAPLWLIGAVAMAHGMVIGLSLAPLHRAAMERIDSTKIGVAAGIYSMIRFAGQSWGRPWPA